MKFKLSLLLGVAALLFALAPRAAHADLGYWSAALVGTWKHPQTGEVYRFNSDATFTHSYAKPTEENVVGASGWWKIAQPTAKESGGSQEGPVALIFKTRKITILGQNGKRYTSDIKNDSRSVVNTVFVKDAENRNLYRIDGVNWKRVK